MFSLNFSCYFLSSAMIDVCCAIIVNETNQVLVAQRSKSMSLPLKMEFPGGKIERGESAEECLLREIKEELNVDVQILSAMPAHEYQYPDLSIRLIPFICKIIGGEIELREHSAYYWFNTDELITCDWAEADVPILKGYLDIYA